MILRRIITTDGDDWRTLKLECGHEVGPIAESKVPKKRKRCLECENVATFGDRHRRSYESMIRHLHGVPMDDRAATLSEWISHYTAASQMLMAIGCEVDDAFWLTQQPSTYPLAAVLFQQ